MQPNDDAVVITVEVLPTFSQSDEAETSDETCAVASFLSSRGDPDKQRSVSPSSVASVNGDAVDDKGDVCCRICLEAVHTSDFDSGYAIRLGCKYIHHLHPLKHG